MWCVSKKSCTWRGSRKGRAQSGRTCTRSLKGRRANRKRCRVRFSRGLLVEAGRTTGTRVCRQAEPQARKPAGRRTGDDGEQVVPAAAHTARMPLNQLPQADRHLLLHLRVCVCNSVDVHSTSKRSLADGQKSQTQGNECGQIRRGQPTGLGPGQAAAVPLICTAVRLALCQYRTMHAAGTGRVWHPPCRAC